MMMKKTLQGLIVRALGGFYYVQVDDHLYECRARGVFRKRETSPVVGDHVEIVVEQNEQGTVSKILPRKNEILRPPLANLDQLFIVTSVCDPVPNLLVLDKFLAMSEYKDIEPIVVVTKQDLKDPQTLVNLYRQAGFQVLSVNNDDPVFAREAFSLLQGKVSAFTGNSGVGKSSFLNAVFPDLQIKTGETSQKLGRGKHTTRDVMLYPLPDGSGYVADTPGFSTMDLMQYDVILKDQLQYCFREFADYTEGCKFHGCSHTVEKGCAVLQALSEGKIAKSRHQSYCTLYEEAKQIKEWERKR